jgi:hypothetical protein
MKTNNSIPRSFKLFATTIHVVFDNKRSDDLKAYGYWHPSESTITLSHMDGASILTPDKIADTFYHEKVHAILDTMHEHKLSSNEKFVDTFAKLLRQSDETAEY